MVEPDPPPLEAPPERTEKRSEDMTLAVPEARVSKFSARDRAALRGEQ